MSQRSPKVNEPVPPSPAPVVVVHGLTYGDLQRGIFLTFGLLLAWQLAQPLTTLLLFFLLVFILAAVVNPVVVRLQRAGVPRPVAAVLLGVGVVVAVAALAALALPPLLDEVSKFIGGLDEKQQRLMGYYQSLLARYPEVGNVLPSPETVFRNLAPRVASFLGKLGVVTLNVAAGILSLLLLLVLVIYTIAEPAPLVAGLLALTPARYRDRMDTALRRILEQLKNWAFGSLILGLIVGALTGIGLSVVGWLTGHGFPYILLFSVIAGIGELIPNIGPILSAIPPVLVALAIDPLLALWVALLFLGIQQAENQLIVPRVMRHFLDLHPVSLIFGMLVMAALFGLLGAILAVPVCAIVKVCWEEFYLAPHGVDSERLEALAEEIVSEEAGAPAG